MNKLWMAGVLTMAVALGGCVSLRSVSMTQVPQDRTNVVTATADSWNLLGIAFSNDFIDEAVLDLKNQCQDGKVEGVLTKHQDWIYFLLIKREVVVSGYCNKG